MFVSVYLDQSLQKPLDYSVPSDLANLVQVGMRVEVPLRKTIVKGTIASIQFESQFPEVKAILKIQIGRAHV